MNILDQLAEHAKYRVEEKKKEVSLSRLRALAEERPLYQDRFFQALQKEGMSFICECKKASPSKGLIAEDFPYVEIAKSYQAAGADAISVLTEPKWFLGSDNYLAEIVRATTLPCLRKDFTVDAYQIYEAKLLGASAVLLIVALLEPAQLAEYLQICKGLGISALVETHDEAEIETALFAGARILGVNNRNLKDFSVDTKNASRLRTMVPSSTLFVAESGISTAEDVALFQKAGVDAVLIGEALMKAPDKRKKLRELRSLL